MIQSVLPTSLPSLMPADSLLQSADNGAEAPDFAALLASGLPAAATSQTQTIAAAPPAQTEAEEPQTAIAATATGNILPPALPLAVPPAAVTVPADVPAWTDPEAAAEPEQPPSEAAALPTAVLTLKPKLAQSSTKAAPATSRRDASRKTSEEDADPVGAQTAASAQTTGEPVATFQPTDMPVALPDRAPAPAVATQQHSALTDAPLPQEQASSSAAEAPRNAPMPHVVPTRAEPAAQALAEAAPQAAFRRSASVAEPVAAPQVPAPASAEARPASAPLLRVEIALPAAAQTERPSETRPAQRRTGLTATPTATAPVLSPDPSMAQPAATLLSVAAPVSAEALRPHDFAALVDRLVAAREAVQPHAATLTVAHAEFGAVELRFRHEERGLTVSLASADPDFARAAAAAPQPVMPASASAAAHGETSQSAPHRDGAASTTGSTGGQSRGQQGERRGDHFAHSNQPQRSAARPGGERRSGIFA